jgi:hypothetical protein
MIATVFDTKTGASQVSIADLPRQLATGGFSWLDIADASTEELRLVASALCLDEPTSTWPPRFGQRARFELGPQRVRISNVHRGSDRCAGRGARPLHARLASDRTRRRG